MHVHFAEAGIVETGKAMSSANTALTFFDTIVSPSFDATTMLSHKSGGSNLKSSNSENCAERTLVRYGQGVSIRVFEKILLQLDQRLS